MQIQHTSNKADSITYLKFNVESLDIATLQPVYTLNTECMLNIYKRDVNTHTQHLSIVSFIRYSSRPTSRALAYCKVTGNDKQCLFPFQPFQSDSRDMSTHFFVLKYAFPIFSRKINLFTIHLLGRLLI